MKKIYAAMLFLIGASSGFSQPNSVADDISKAVKFKVFMCKSDCASDHFNLKILVVNDSYDSIVLEKFSLKTKLTLSYQPVDVKKKKGGKKKETNTYKTLSFAPGGAYSADSVRINPNEIFGIEQSIKIDKTNQDMCAAKSVKVYGYVTVLDDGKPSDIEVNQDIKNDCNL